MFFIEIEKGSVLHYKGVIKRWSNEVRILEKDPVHHLLRIEFLHPCDTKETWVLPYTLHTK